METEKFVKFQTQIDFFIDFNLIYFMRKVSKLVRHKDVDFARTNIIKLFTT